MAHTPVTLRFSATPYRIKDWVVLQLPEQESRKLPSRGQVSTELTIDGKTFAVVVEPDGRLGHWIRLTDELQQAAGTGTSGGIDVNLTTTASWPEPVIPGDFAAALKIAPQSVKDKWQDITPMARWEWIRWMNATLSQETRAVRIEKTVSKLAGKHRRPCCFNLAACTEMYVAKRGQLIERG